MITNAGDLDSAILELLQRQADLSVANNCHLTDWLIEKLFERTGRRYSHSRIVAAIQSLADQGELEVEEKTVELREVLTQQATQYLSRRFRLKDAARTQVGFVMELA